MIHIAHRGNYQGRNINEENKPSYINKAIENGYNAEVDFWLVDGKFWSGHDSPMYQLPTSMLENNKIWYHAKNILAVEYLSRNKKIHWFWHESDNITLTSRGIIWTFPGTVIKNSIINQPKNILKFAYEKCYAGICSDDFSEINK